MQGDIQQKDINIAYDKKVLWTCCSDMNPPQAGTTTLAGRLRPEQGDPNLSRGIQAVGGGPQT